MTTKEVQEALKIKLPDGIVFNLSIFSRGSIKEYLAHVVVVLHLISQKGLDMQCRKLAKAVDKLARTLKNLLKAAGSKTTVSSDDDLEARKLKIDQT